MSLAAYKLIRSEMAKYAKHIFNARSEMNKFISLTSLENKLIHFTHSFRL